MRLRRDFEEGRRGNTTWLGTEPFRLGKPSHLPFAGKEFFGSRNLICNWTFAEAARYGFFSMKPILKLVD
jgi:hypothetical protein